MNEKGRQGDREGTAIRRKPQPKHDRKPLSRGLAHLKLAAKKTEHLPTENKHAPALRFKGNDSILQANVSVIEGSSFISNKHDHSMDSMDKMIIGVTGEDERESEENSKYSGGLDVDLTAIHREYEQLIGRSRLLGEGLEEEEDPPEEDGSRLLPPEEEEQEKEEWPAKAEERERE